MAQSAHQTRDAARSFSRVINWIHTWLLPSWLWILLWFMLVPVTCRVPRASTGFLRHSCCPLLVPQRRHALTLTAAAACCLPLCDVWLHEMRYIHVKLFFAKWKEDPKRNEIETRSETRRKPLMTMGARIRMWTDSRWAEVLRGKRANG